MVRIGPGITAVALAVGTVLTAQAPAPAQALTPMTAAASSGGAVPCLDARGAVRRLVKPRACHLAISGGFGTYLTGLRWTGRSQARGRVRDYDVALYRAAAITFSRPRSGVFTRVTFGGSTFRLRRR